MTGQSWRVRLCMSAVLTMMLVCGGIFRFAPAAHAASLRPQWIECQYTRAAAVGTNHQVWSWGEVWVTFDKLVDSTNGAFCGEIRNHSQLRLYNGGPSGQLGGWIDYGQDASHSYDHTLNNSPKTSVPANNSGSTKWYDNWGAWVVASCGHVQAVFYQSNGSGWGSGYFSPSGYCVA